MTILLGCVLGFIVWFLSRYLVGGLFTVNQNERAVKTSFGRAERVGDATTLQDPIAEHLPAELEQHSGVLRLDRGGEVAGWLRHRAPFGSMHDVVIRRTTWMTPPILPNG